ncbi:xanthine dehydrogenase family protein molybdopterin-binding subunit [Bradyrhizobium brasilense]|uniref:xanthine dehydrogenase family protein molybdopterin-binding subunit n=1 Tax=Bradyrhizobium brasilense TaxID=1419277 RepID=UPI0024B0B359|nr:xanthine dehydrogenase family protein molybdopterin-binding subunit [Bradyrhizobium australafricanum]WFU31339.1 xanthine dehydrogenase family protein molybdopterin-binding subunit [Bradyrhizobium australafricanum]
MNAPARIGLPIARSEDRRFLTGRGRYAGNTAPAELSSVLFVRSPHAHARIVRMDKKAAFTAPGVVAIYTAEDTAADRLGHLPVISEVTDAEGKRHREPSHPPMPVGKVRHVGDIVAMIIAGTLNQARDAAELLAVNYEELPAVVTVAQALAPNAPLLHDEAPGNLMCRWSKGNAAATDLAFAKAAHVSKLTIRSPRQIVHYLEPRAVWSAYDAANDVVTLTLSSQGVHIPHRLLCERVLGLANDQLRLVTEDVGGGFGPKYQIYAEAALMAWATRKLGRGLRWTCERSELAVADVHSRDLVASAELALDANGRFLALRVKAEANIGAYVSMFAPTTPTTGLAKVISGLYRIPAIYADFECAFTNTVPVDAMRGAGKPEALFLLERLVDTAAHETGRSPIELRRLNLLKLEDMPYVAASGYTYDAADCRRLFETALDAADEPFLEIRRATSQARGLRRGFGLSCHLHATGGIADERAIIEVEAQRVLAKVGTQSQGQGHETVYAQILSAALGVPVDTIGIRQGDTCTIPQGGGTGGSSSMIISGTTLRRAADVVIQRGLNLAAERLETASQDISFRNGAFEVVGTDRRISLLELAAWKPFQGEAVFADKVESYPTGVMVCEVEVDPETGLTRIDRLTAIADCGVVVNPRLLAGQMHGGTVQGVGYALMEAAIYDEGTGQLLSRNLMSYALPRADDVPRFRIETISTPSPNNYMGLKGVGELPTNGAPAAVANAVVDALRPLGVRHLDMPITAYKVWRALNPGK